MDGATLLRTALAVTATAVAGGLATDPQSPWYRSLRTPPWQPPPPAYGLVWTPLYADLAVTSARALDGLAEAGRGSAPPTRAALAANLVLNAGWNVLFFRARRPWLAAAECAVPHCRARRTSSAGPQPSTAALPWHSPPTRRGAVSRQPSRSRSPAGTDSGTDRPGGFSSFSGVCPPPLWVDSLMSLHVPEWGSRPTGRKGIEKRG